MSTARAVHLGAPGGTVETAAGTTLTASGVVDGLGALIKTGAGVLILDGANSHAGGTTVTQGTLQISRDANLGDASGDLTLDGGTLRTTADMTSDRTLTVAADSGVVTDADTTLTWSGEMVGGGVFTKAGAGTLVFNGDGAAFAGGGIVGGGTLAVDSYLAGALSVLSGGRLEGIGRTGDVTNSGVVAPGRSIGVLTVGNYIGAGGRLEIEAELGGDASPSDRLVVTGATSGSTLVTVINRGGQGAQTVEGIKIIDVAGPSNGDFVLDGDYLFEGDPAIIAGAYGYRLFKNGLSDPNDGDWYLRSALTDPEPPPLYQPGSPIYEAYPQALAAMNSVPTLQQRVGDRAWSNGAPKEEGVWGRLEGFAWRPNAVVSTTGADLSVDRWRLQFGVDKTLSEQEDGGRLVGGVTAHHGGGDSSIRSIYGDGSIETQTFGLGATLTWYGAQGAYVDGQASFSWFDSDIRSDVLGRLAIGNDGFGQAYSLEAGVRRPLNDTLTLTPQFQMIYSRVGFDRFTDPAAAEISDEKGDSFKTRLGLSIDHRDDAGPEGRVHLYGIADVTYEWLDGTRVDVSQTALDHRDNRFWVNVGVGGTRSWNNDRITLYGEIQATTAVDDFGDSYGFKGVLGVRMSF